MEALSLIKNLDQYHHYCSEVERLAEMEETEEINDQIEHLLLLIEKWDKEHNPLPEMDPVELIKALMKNKGLKARDLVRDLEIDKTQLSAILNYRKGFSKRITRLLADYFKINQEALNRPYPLKESGKKKAH
ncbi:MAG: transcriptional regulator [Bacteroidia bacterium]|nr:transcriptional regulator [Bacteroidia bacterium]